MLPDADAVAVDVLLERLERWHPGSRKDHIERAIRLYYMVRALAALRDPGVRKAIGAAAWKKALAEGERLLEAEMTAAFPKWCPDDVAAGDARMN